MFSQFDISELKVALYEAAEEIKKLQSEAQISSKTSVVDLVTTADLKSEEILINKIQKIFPHDGIISEESEPINENSNRKWVIDPLDGTVNYANNIPQVAITILLVEDSIPIQAIVLDIYRDHIYEGYKGYGAFKDGLKLIISKKTEMKKALVATGFPYDRVLNSQQYIPTFETILKNSGGIRRYGSAALDVCWVADNKFDAYYEFFIKPWDTLGASLILDEAGGCVEDETERFPSMKSNLIIASNSSIHKEFKELVLSNISQDLKTKLF
jgi:myo-inositol-1(or 4)-monophosphatase